MIRKGPEWQAVEVVKEITGLVTTYKVGTRLLGTLEPSGKTYTLEQENGCGCIIGVPAHYLREVEYDPDDIPDEWRRA